VTSVRVFVSPADRVVIQRDPAFQSIYKNSENIQTHVIHHNAFNCMSMSRHLSLSYIRVSNNALGYFCIHRPTANNICVRASRFIHFCVSTYSVLSVYSAV